MMPERLSSDTSPDGVYSEFRSGALSMTSTRRTELGLPASVEAPVWGILMEFGYPGASVTLFALADGHTSLYYSHGGGVLGGGLHESVRQAVTPFIEMANRCFKHLTPAESFPVPAAEHTTFYALTDSGVFTGGGRTDDLGDDQHPLSPLYHAGHEVLTQLRLLGPTRPEPADVETCFNRGVASAQQGDWDQAIAAFSEVIRLKPDCAEAYGGRGFAYSKKDDLDRAIADFNEAIRLKPDLAPPYCDRGWAYAKKGDAERAITDCTQAIRLNPQYANAYTNRGLGYVIQGDFDRAVADLSEAIRLAPDFGAPYRIRGVAFSQQGHLDRAIADYSAAIRLEPNVAETYHARGSAYEQKGESEKAAADFRKAQELAQ
jgi:Flp pilus assembly protein TadD